MDDWPPKADLVAADPIITIALQPSAPRFLSFLGVEAPPISELLGEADKGLAHLPLHLKPDAIGRITATERAIILALPFATPGRKERLTESLRWLHDAKLYEALRASRPPGRQTGRTALRRKQTSLLVRLGKLDIDPDPAAAGCECNLFTVPEAAKGRLRIILESLCNDWIYKSDLSRFKLPIHSPFLPRGRRFPCAGFGNGFPGSMRRGAGNLRGAR